jgi:hypothetical protein
MPIDLPTRPSRERTTSGAAPSASPSTRAIRAGRWIAAAVAAALLAMSLVPVSQGRPLPHTCIICGFMGTADFILNILVYVPLGAAVWVGWRRGGVAVAAGFGLSLFVELSQFLVPGRDPTLGDLLANTLGAAAGMALASGWRAWAAPSRRAADGLALAAAALVLAVVAVTGVAMEPAIPRAPLRVEWAAKTEYLARYPGRVLAATLGGIALSPSAVGETEVAPAPALDAERIRRAFLEGGTIDVRAVAGPAPASLAPLVGVYYPAPQSEVLLVGVERDQVVLRYRTRSIAMRLQQPSLRIPGALRGVAAGDTFSVRVRRVARGFEMSVRGREARRLGFTPGRGWRVLYGVPFIPAKTMSTVWMAMLFLPLGLWLRRTWIGAVALALVIAGLVLIPPAVHLLPLPWWEILGAAAGLASGAATSRAVAPRRS